MRVLLIVSALALACFAQNQTVNKKTPHDDTNLRATQRQWVDAYYRGDTETLARIEADDFTMIVNGETPQTKAEQLAVFASRAQNDNPTHTEEGEEVRHYGEVALITGLSKAPSDSVRFTVVWVKASGQWKVVHLNYSTAK